VLLVVDLAIALAALNVHAGGALYAIRYVTTAVSRSCVPVSGSNSCKLAISVGDAEQLRRANPAARLAVLPDTNHVLETVTSDDRTANVATYTDPSLPLALA
jgi:hypothetical protein